MGFKPKNYNRPRVRVDCQDPSKAKQSFAKRSDINNIVSRYMKTGKLTTGYSSDRMAKFGDFTSATDYFESMLKLRDANNAFMELPPDVRNRFKNSPGELIDFVKNPDNIVEGIELGLVKLPEGKMIKEGKLVDEVKTSPATPPPPSA